MPARRTSSSTTPTRPPVGAFSIVSFIGGSLLSAAIVGAIMYKPELPCTPGEPTVTYFECTFMEELANAKVETGVEFPKEYHLLAAHFPRNEDAKVLQAELLLDGMPAYIATKHQVMLGPYASESVAQDARDRLHDREISTQVLVRPLQEKLGFRETTRDDVVFDEAWNQPRST